MTVRKSIIAAIGRRRELGKGNDLLWHIPEDLAHFKNITGTAPVIMGRATYFSLPQKFRPLPGRENIVLMRAGELLPQGEVPHVVVAHDLDSAFAHAIQVASDTGADEVFVIGGASIYAQTLTMVDRLYLTEVDASFPDADVFFPPYKDLFTKEIARESHQNKDYAFDFVIVEK